MTRIGSTHEVIRQVPAQTGVTMPPGEVPICNDESSDNDEVVLSSDRRLLLSEADRAVVLDMLCATRFSGIVL